MIKKLLVLISIILLPACAARTSTRITRYHDSNNGKLMGSSYSFKPNTKQANSLEYKAFRKKVKQQLKAINFDEVKGSKQAAVSFEYSVSKPQVSYSQEPIYSSIPTGSNGQYMRIQTGTRSVKHVSYGKDVKLKIEDITKTPPSSIFEAKASLAGSKSDFSEMDCMLKAIFTNFPGTDGIEEVITIKNKECEHFDPFAQLEGFE